MTSLRAAASTVMSGWSGGGPCRAGAELGSINIKAQSARAKSALGRFIIYSLLVLSGWLGSCNRLGRQPCNTTAPPQGSTFTLRCDRAGRDVTSGRQKQAVTVTTREEFSG